MSRNENQPGLWDQPDPSERASDRHRRPRTPSRSTPGHAAGPPSVPPGGDRLWTIDDVSQFLGVPQKTIHAWRTAGKGPKGFRVGKHLRWHPRAVFAWSLQQLDK